MFDNTSNAAAKERERLAQMTKEEFLEEYEKGNPFAVQWVQMINR
jgi:hypothetical protein